MTGDDMSALQQLITIFGGTSPLVAVLVWSIMRADKREERRDQRLSDLVESFHGIDKRLAVVENELGLKHWSAADP